MFEPFAAPPSNPPKKQAKQEKQAKQGVGSRSGKTFGTAAKPLAPVAGKRKKKHRSKDWKRQQEERRFVVSRLSIEQEQSVGFASEEPKNAQREKGKGSGASTETLPEKEEQEAPKKWLFVATREGRNARQPAALPLD